MAAPGPEYVNGIFSCGESCLTTCFLPCVTVGATEGMVESGAVQSPCSGFGGPCFINCLAVGCGFGPCYGAMVTRSKLRTKFGMTPNCFGDCVMHCCCPCCAVMQDYNEVKQRTLLLSPGQAPDKVTM